jgi:hypothetical protein
MWNVGWCRFVTLHLASRSNRYTFTSNLHREIGSHLAKKLERTVDNDNACEKDDGEVLH